MLDVTDLQLADVVSMGTRLRAFGEGCKSFEEVARKIVDHLHAELGSGGVQQAVLTRMYRTHPLGNLPPELQSFAQGIVADRPLEPATRCLVLVATRGSREQWCDRRQSKGHQAIPLPDPEFVGRLPMVAEVLRQLGVGVGNVLYPSEATMGELERRQFNVFLVEDAAGSAYIPAQADFVLRDGVRSVMAFGGVLPGGDLFVTLLFSRVPISREVADLFGPLALSAKLAVLSIGRAPLLSADSAT